MGMMRVKDAMRLDEKVLEEPDRAQNEREANRGGRQVGVQTAEQANPDQLDGERGQRNQDRGHVKPCLPAHFVPSIIAFSSSWGSSGESVKYVTGVVRLQ